MGEDRVLNSAKQFVFGFKDMKKKKVCSIGCFLTGLVMHISNFNEEELESLKRYVQNESSELMHIIDKAIGLVAETKESF